MAQKLLASAQPHTHHEENVGDIAGLSQILEVVDGVTVHTLPPISWKLKFRTDPFLTRIVSS